MVFQRALVRGPQGSAQKDRAQGQDGLGPVHGPTHAREFEALSVDRFAGGFRDSAPDRNVAPFEFRVVHPAGAFPKETASRAELGPLGLGHRTSFGQGRRGMQHAFGPRPWRLSLPSIRRAHLRPAGLWSPKSAWAIVHTRIAVW